MQRARCLTTLVHGSKFLRRGAAIRRWNSTSAAAAAAQAEVQVQALDDKNLWVASPHPDVDLPVGITLPEYLRAHVGGWGNRIAFECGITGRKYTHDEIYSTSDSFAAALLKSKKYSRGDVIGVCLPNVPEYTSVVFGIWQAGLIASTVNPAYTADEIGRQLGNKNSGAKAVVTTPEYLPVVQAAKESAQCSALQSIIVVGEPQPGCLNYFDMAKCDTWGVQLFRGQDVDTRKTTCLLPYSSGTTGNPKGVELTHFNMVANLMQIISPSVSPIKPTTNWFQERFLGLLPMFHIYGLVATISVGMVRGTHTVTLPKFNPDTFLATIRSHKPTTLHVVPPLMNHIINCDDFGADELAETANVLVGAAPVGPVLIRRFEEKAQRDNLIFQEGYGMTELSPVSHLLPPGTHGQKAGSCGGPVSNTLTKLVDVTSGATVGRGVRGEVCVKGPQVMKGYYKNPEATRATIDSDGWLHTGDIGYYDEDGFLFVVDRLKELIKVKGFQVAPSELEDLLREHPGVQDVAVVGVPDEISGELPYATIVKKDKNLREEDVHEYLKPKIASFKQLRAGVQFVEAIPKAASGKILRRQILDEWKRKHGVN